MQETPLPPQSPDENGDEISLLDLLIALGEEKKTVLGVTIFTIVAAILYTLTLTPMFTAKTVIMPPQQQQSSTASVLAGLGALAGAAGAVGGVKTPEELHISLLTTESVQGGVIEKLKLKEHYEKRSLADTRVALNSRIKIAGDRKTGLITIEADDEDAAFAAQLANAHVDELRKLLGRLAVTEAQQRRAFFEQQLVKTKEALVVAELRFRQEKENSGMQVTETLASQSVRESANLRGQIAAREVQLQAMRTFATSANPDVQRIVGEIAALRSQLIRVEQGSGVARAASLDGHSAVEAYRDVKLQEAMLEAYVRQLEVARADEAREGPMLQQIDIATVPERRSKPNRRQIVVLASLGGLILGLLIALIHAAVRKATKDPESSARIAACLRAWSYWRSRDRRPVP